MLRVLIITFSIIVILFVLPWVMGLIANHKIQSLIQQYPQLQLSEYQRGWFKSEATLKLNLNDSLSQFFSSQSEHNLYFNVTIYHGPVIINKNQENLLFATAYCEARKIFKPALENELKTHSLLNTDITNDFTLLLNGDYRLRANIDAISLKNGGNYFDVKNIKLQSQLNNNLTATKLTIDSLKLKENNLEIVLRNSEYISHQHKDKTDMDFSTEIASIFYGPELIKLTNFKLKYLDNIFNNNISFYFTVNFSTLLFNDILFKNGKLNLAIERLDYLQFNILLTLINLYESGLSDDNILFDTIKNIVQKNTFLYFSIKSLQTPKGVIEFNISIYPSHHIKNIMTIEEWMKKWNLSIYLNVDNRVIDNLLISLFYEEIQSSINQSVILQRKSNQELKQFAIYTTHQLLTTWLASGILLIDKNNYKSKINYFNGIWYFNNLRYK